MEPSATSFSKTRNFLETVKKLTNQSRYRADVSNGLSPASVSLRDENNNSKVEAASAENSAHAPVDQHQEQRACDTDVSQKIRESTVTKHFDLVKPANATSCDSHASQDTGEKNNNTDDAFVELSHKSVMAASENSCEAYSDSDDAVDESMYDYIFYEPKIKDNRAEKFGCDKIYEHVSDVKLSNLLSENWYQETCYQGHLLENYVEIDGKYYKTSSLPQTEDSSVSGNMLEDIYADDGSNIVFHDWSRIVKSDKDRNEIYDKWMLDLVTWERNRLIWLDQTGLIEGFDSSCDMDRTFLVKVGDVDPDSPQLADHTKASDVDQNDLNSKRNLNESQDELWEDWYKLERLKCHKRLHDMGLPNWYDDLVSEQDNVSLCKVSTLNDIEIVDSAPFNGTPSQTIVEDKKDKTEIFSCEVSDDILRVYQFTDRNLWRKYHNYFKQGKHFE